VNVQWSEVDGVPTVYAQEGQVPGPLHACLMFRTGRCDETLTVSGINHVIEHLVLHALGTTSYGWNGDVSPVTTRFTAMGGPDEIVDYCAFVTRQLRHLPVERLADEVRVLEIEGLRRGGSQLGLDLSLRLGPRGAGLVGWPEHGLRRLDAEEIITWTQQRFTLDNAVLWLSGPIPPGLHLHELPRAERPEPTPMPSLPMTERTFICSDTRVVSISFLSELQYEVTAVMELARRRAHDRLRRRALSYSIDYSHVRVSADCALEYLEADGTAETLPEVALELTDIVDKLARLGPTNDELEVMRAQWRRLHGHPDAILNYLDSSARARLFDQPMETPEEIEARWEAYTPRSLSDALSSIRATVRLIGPEDVAAKLEGWAPYSDMTTDRIDGTTYEPIGSREKGTLIVGSDGVSWGLTEHERRTIRWDDVQMCFTFDSGARTLVGATGSTIYITPWHWRAGERLTELIDKSVDPLRSVRLGEGRTHFDDHQRGGRTDLRWLGSLTGVLQQRRRFDIVIDTDGVFVLVHLRTTTSPTEHHGELRAADRESLLAINRENRWIPRDEIERVTLQQRTLGRVSKLKAVLTIQTRAGEQLGFYLTTDQQIAVARTELAKLLATQFHHTPRKAKS
jgi:hypothetical protein